MTPLTARDGTLIAGINSFGYGGTNAHVVLEAAPTQETKQTNRVEARPYLYPLSARCEPALLEQAANHARLLGDACDPGALTRAAAIQRDHLRHRLVVSGRDVETLQAALHDFHAGSQHHEALTYGQPQAGDGRIVFVYSGMGPQWWRMGRTLYETEPVFRAVAGRCDKVFTSLAGWSVLEEMLRDEATSRMAETEIAQPANAVLQIALTELLESWGIRPDAVVGHSVGEVASIYRAGVYSLEDAMRVSWQRSRLQAKTAGMGGMLAVGLSPEEADSWVTHYGHDVAVAAVNSPTAVTLAGRREVLDLIDTRLQEEQRFSRFLRVEVPYHSPVMDVIKDELFEELAILRPQAPNMPLYATTSGQRVEHVCHDAAYWWENVRGTVRFADAIDAMMDDGYRIFVEIGPHPVLLNALQQNMQKQGVDGIGVPTLNRKKNEWEAITGTLARLYTLGCDVDWQAYNGDGPFVPLPTYPWQHKAHWLESVAAARDRLPHQGHPLLTRRLTQPGFWWQSSLNLHTFPYLVDHEVNDAVLFPGSGFLEVALAAADEAGGLPVLEQVHFLKAMELGDGKVARLHIEINRDEHRFFIHGTHDDTHWNLCCTGEILDQESRPSALYTRPDKADFGERLDAEILYNTLEKRGLVYGTCFRAVTGFYRRPGEVLAEIALHEDLSDEGYFVHPCLLDACFHSLIASTSGDERQRILPEGLERLRIYEPAGRQLMCHGRVRRVDAGHIVGDLTLISWDGRIIGQVDGLSCRILPNPHLESLDHKLTRWSYLRNWEEATPSEPLPAIRWIAIGAAPMENTLPVVQEAEQFTGPGILLLPDDSSGEAVRDTLHRLPEGEPVWVLDLRPLSVQTPQDDVLIDKSAAMSMAFLETVNALPANRIARYCLVTRAVESLSDELPGLVGAPLSGLARTVMTERPDLQLTCLDLEQGCSTDTPRILNLLASAGDEQELALRGDKLHVCRLVHHEHMAEVVRPPEIAPSGTPFILKQGEKGDLDSLQLHRKTLPSLKPDEVLLEVVAVPLGFKDVLKGLGLISNTALQNTFFGHGMGMEGCGVIRAVGSKITHVKVGDRVAGFATNFLSSHLVAEGKRVARIPDNLSFEEGGNLIAFMTSWYALIDVARLRQGERILIHGATGGVGLAAIEIARMLGAEIYATAGSDEKRAWLRETMGIQYNLFS